ncbi:hypothetical protein GCM10025868_39010 [Angustibacter aerolatus]|uniref:Uncharacterized protein n=1 Tax=Angustibacter aerolatus TaxID=1162965 RepID=A0ABQ6JM67_9ACTN|nr:hypothetical protein GCM10025868_39010 [Angustibacter aerolatus]
MKALNRPDTTAFEAPKTPPNTDVQSDCEVARFCRLVLHLRHDAVLGVEVAEHPALQQVLHVVGCVRGQRGGLGDDRRHHEGDHPDEQQHDPQQHQPHGPAAAVHPPLDRPHHRVEPERQEQRHHEQGDHRRQVAGRR